MKARLWNLALAALVAASLPAVASSGQTARDDSVPAHDAASAKLEQRLDEAERFLNQTTMEIDPLRNEAAQPAELGDGAGLCSGDCQGDNHFTSGWNCVYCQWAWTYTSGSTVYTYCLAHNGDRYWSTTDEKSTTIIEAAGSVHAVCFYITSISGNSFSWNDVALYWTQ